MKKLISKITALSVGLAMVIGGGVALSSKKVGETKAVNYVESAADSFDATKKSYSINTYKSTLDYDSWTIKYGSNYNGAWAYFKMGAKSADLPNYSDTSIYLNTGSTRQIDKITVHGPAGSLSKNGMAVSSWGLYVYSNAAMTSQIDYVAGNVSDITTSAWETDFYPTTNVTWGAGSYFKVSWTLSNTTTTNGIICVDKITCLYESSTPRGEISINDLSSRSLIVGSNGTLSYNWTPASGDSATITSATWTSSDSTIVSITGSSYSCLKPGVVDFTLDATDSNSEVYSVTSIKYIVTNSYEFEIGDNVALYSPTANVELKEIVSGNYGTGETFVTTPNGIYLMEVESGTEPGSFAFKNDTKYLSWSSGNTLITSDSLTANSSWFVINYDTYTVIANASSLSREIWWNSSASPSRFACYEGKTPETTGYGAVNVIKVESAPVRGTIAILNNFGTAIREDVAGYLEFEFTPAQDDSATITSHTWTSSNTDVLAINGDYYTGVGPGKVKVTLDAEDSNGQLYSVTTTEFTLVEIVTGNYEKKTSVSVGDTVVLACNSAGTQMAGISGKVGTYVFYDLAPADVYTFVVEEGNNSSSYALKHEDKYLNWSTGTDISLVDEITDNSSWTIEFDEDGDATIACVALDGEAHRYMAWNSSSPRFTTYKTGQTPIQLYGPAATYGAASFAQDLISLTNDQCSVYETDDYNFEEAQAIFESVWESLAGENYFGKLSDAEVLVLEEATADASSTDVVEKAMYRYDLITAKYGLTNFISGRTPTLGRYIPAYESNVDSSSSVAIIIVVAVASMTLLGTTLIIRKRKHQ